MTRLEERDINCVARQLDDYDANLKRRTGVSLRQIACLAAGVDEASIVDLQNRVRFAAVSISSGLGVIGGFCNTVAAIVSHIGFDAFVTEACDVAGIAEGLEQGADVLLLADDHRFVALAPESRLVVDNAQATAMGFVVGLELMRGGISGESVLVLGCGPVGVAAAKALSDRGAKVALCDTRQERAVAAFTEMGQYASDRVRMEDTRSAVLDHYELIFDASNTGDFIEPAHLTRQTMVAAPGMPCALTPEAMKVHRDRVLHDALEIGTATMAVQAAAGLEAGEARKKAKK